MMELTANLKRQIVVYAIYLAAATDITFHKFAHKPGYMIAVESTHASGFLEFVDWLEMEVELDDVDVIRTLPEEDAATDAASMSLESLQHAYEKIGIAFPVDDGCFTSLVVENEGGQTHAF